MDSQIEGIEEQERSSNDFLTKKIFYLAGVTILILAISGVFLFFREIDVVGEVGKLPTFIFLKQVMDDKSGQERISIGRYKDNEDVVTTVGELFSPISNRSIAYTKDHSGIIVAAGSSLTHLSAEGNSKGELLNLSKKFGQEATIFVESPVFSPDGDKIAYLADIHTPQYSVTQVRVFTMSSGNDEVLVDNLRENIVDNYNPYNNLKFSDYLNPLYWFKDDSGEKLLLAQQDSIGGFLSRVWIYDFNNDSIVPIDTYDAYGYVMGECNFKKTCSNIYSILAQSGSGRYALINLEGVKSENVERNLFVLDFSVLFNNPNNELLNAAISLPVCGQKFFTEYVWSPDERSIACTEYTINDFQTEDLFEGRIRKQYQVEFASYAITIETKEKKLLQKQSQRVDIPQEFISAFNEYFSDENYAGGGENYFFAFYQFIEQQAERIIGWLPGNFFVVSRRNVMIENGRELIVKDFQGSEYVMDTIEHKGAYQFLGWVLSKTFDEKKAGIIKDDTPMLNETVNSIDLHHENIDSFIYKGWTKGDTGSFNGLKRSYFYKADTQVAAYSDKGKNMSDYLVFIAEFSNIASAKIFINEFLSDTTHMEYLPEVPNVHVLIDDNNERAALIWRQDNVIVFIRTNDTEMRGQFLDTAYGMYSKIVSPK